MGIGTPISQSSAPFPNPIFDLQPLRKTVVVVERWQRAGEPLVPLALVDEEPPVSLGCALAPNLGAKPIQRVEWNLSAVFEFVRFSTQTVDVLSLKERKTTWTKIVSRAR